MNVQHILSKALEDYDRTVPVIKYLIDTCLQPEVIRDQSGNNRTVFIFKSKTTKEIILETEVETFAIYANAHKVWSWAWAIPGFNLVENSLSRDILVHALSMEPQLAYIKAIITTSRGRITNPTQLDINLALGTCLIKNTYIYPFIYEIEKGQGVCYYNVLINTTALKEIGNKIDI
jgi:hypothetical protein